MTRGEEHGDGLDDDVRSMFSSMPTLATFPYVVVRLGCSKCSRAGRYRLARLAARYGPETRMIDVLAKLAGNCARWDAQQPGIDRCGAIFIDLAGGPPPDHPPMRR